MIIGPDFVWLHFPKCGGMAVEAALRILLASRADVRFDLQEPSNVIWHHTIRARERYDQSFVLGERRVICGFRRLPSWLLSRVHFEVARGPKNHVPTREMLLEGRFYEANGTANKADEYAEKYSSPRVDHWICTEHLPEDLSAAFRLDVNAVRQVLPRKNVTEIAYVKPLSFWFTDEEICSLYAANPVWTRLEQEVYGSLPSACGEAWNQTVTAGIMESSVG